MSIQLTTGILQQIKNRGSGDMPLLLDTYPAFCAISTKNIGNAPTAAIRAQRTDTEGTQADFTYTEMINGTLAAWATGGTDNTLNHALAVIVYDPTGNGKHMTANASEAPKIVDNGVLCVDVSGAPAFKFEGAQFFTITGLGVISSLLPGANNTTNPFGVSYFARVQFTDVTTTSYAVFHDSNGTFSKGTIMRDGDGVQNRLRLVIDPANNKGFYRRSAILTLNTIYTLSVRADWDGGGATDGLITNARALNNQTEITTVGSSNTGSTRNSTRTLWVGKNHDSSSGEIIYFKGYLSVFIAYSHNVGANDLLINEMINTTF